MEIFSNEKQKQNDKDLKERLDMQKDFREVFGTVQGKRVLNVILNDLSFFGICNSEREMANRNYASYMILERMGFNNTISFCENLLKCEHEE